MVTGELLHGDPTFSHEFSTIHKLSACSNEGLSFGGPRTPMWRSFGRVCFGIRCRRYNSLRSWPQCRTPCNHLYPVSPISASTAPPLLLLMASPSPPSSPRHPRSHCHHRPKMRRSRLALALVYIFSLLLIGAFSFNNHPPEPPPPIIVDSHGDDHPSSFPLQFTSVETRLAPEGAISTSPAPGTGVGTNPAVREAKAGILGNGSTLPSSGVDLSTRIAARELKVGILGSGTLSSLSPPPSEVRIPRAVYGYSTVQPSLVQRRCDLYSGTWVRDTEGRYPLYKPGSCPFVEKSWSCKKNGRPDRGYQKWRWKPNGCDLPRFDAIDFLERLRDKTLLFVGDSLARNQFESMLCLLRQPLPDKSSMYWEKGRRKPRRQGYLSAKFADYNCSIAYCTSYFLVNRGYRLDPQGATRPTLLINRIDNSSSVWNLADMLIFNTGHWWNARNTLDGKDFYKGGSRLFPFLRTERAYRRAMKTWAAWIEKNMDPRKHTVFFRGFEDVFYRGGGWDPGGRCDRETKPVLRGSFLNNYPWQIKIAVDVIRSMKFPVTVMDVTKMTIMRRDGHPSMYGVVSHEGVQDCGHWCLPGVPDAWNELLYANLVFGQVRTMEEG